MKHGSMTKIDIKTQPQMLTEVHLRPAKRILYLCEEQFEDLDEASVGPDMSILSCSDLHMCNYELLASHPIQIYTCVSVVLYSL
ncbi:hypothetical protein HanRHA438_Chr04g0158891 [Helianthus annuus]|nr:hypothetical protein HanRHA438_Chr04g0158891 [Helianthus annuus]